MQQLVILLGWLVLCVLVKGVTICLLWEWFITPMFDYTLSFAHALGIGVFFTMLMGYTKQLEGYKWMGAHLTSIVIGYIVHLFM